jgi:hypothetical protein
LCVSMRFLDLVLAQDRVLGPFEIKPIPASLSPIAQGRRRKGSQPRFGLWL